MLDLYVFKQSKIHTMAWNTFKISYTSTFNNIEDTWIQNLKHGTTIEQTGIYDIYDASKAIANYNQPFPENDSTISDTLSFPDIFKENNEDYENVSYDFESFFINITAKETNY